MEYFKKNLTLTISLAVALVLAAFLGFKIKQSASRALEAAGTVEELRKFGVDEKNAPFSATAANQDISDANLARASREVEKIKMALYARSRVDYNPRVSNTKCKNYLVEGTKALVGQLRSNANLIRVPQSIVAEGLSFADVISSEKLPDESTEVPVLMKQFEIVKEIVRLVVTCQLEALNGIRRIGGVGVAEADDFELMPLSMEVQGDFGAVKELLTKLQNDSKYFFVIRKVTLSAPDAVNSVASFTPEGTPAPGRRRRAIPDMMETEMGRGSEAAPLPEVPPMQLRRVEFSRRITADIRFDFVEFKNPVVEN